MNFALLSFLFVAFSISAAEVVNDRGEVVIDPTAKNLRVKQLNLEPYSQSASVRLARKCPCPQPNPKGDTCLDCGGGCDCGDGLTVKLNLKDAGDQILYQTFSSAGHGSVTVVMKEGKLARVSVSSSCCGCCDGSCPKPDQE